MAVLKGIYHVDNGISLDEIHFKTSADMVKMLDGRTLQDILNGLTGSFGNTANGYIKIPVKNSLETNIKFLIIQWGARTTGSFGTSTLAQMKDTFAIAFPTRCINSIVSVQNNEDSRAVYGWSMGHTASDIEFVAYSPDKRRCNIFYIAIGY